MNVDNGNWLKRALNYFNRSRVFKGSRMKLNHYKRM